MAMRPAPQSAVPYAGTNRDQGGADHLLAARAPAQHSLPVLASAILSPAAQSRRVCTYLSNCALIEHFIQYRQIVRDFEAQLAEFLAGEANKTQTPEASPAVPKHNPAVSTKIASWVCT